MADSDEPVGLVVIGPTVADQLARIVGPHHQAPFGRTVCSVLIVRR